MMTLLMATLIASLGQVDKKQLEDERDAVDSAYEKIVGAYVADGSGLSPAEEDRAKRLLERRKQLEEMMLALEADETIRPSSGAGVSDSFAAIIEKYYLGVKKSQFETQAQYRSRRQPPPNGVLTFDLPVENQSQLAGVGMVETQVEFPYDAEKAEYRANIKFTKEEHVGFALYDADGKSVPVIDNPISNRSSQKSMSLPQHFIVFHNSVDRTPFTGTNAFGATVRAYDYSGKTYAGYPKNLDRFASANGLATHQTHRFIVWSIPIKVPRDQAKVMQPNLKAKLDVRFSPDGHYTESSFFQTATFNDRQRALIRRYSVVVEIVGLTVYDSATGRVLRRARSD